MKKRKELPKLEIMGTTENNRGIYFEVFGMVAKVTFEVLAFAPPSNEGGAK